MTKKVSVIMSVYNDEKFVKQAIDGVLSSTFEDFEFIICNDCSKDSSAEIIKSYNDERILFFENEVNKGLANSLNECIKRASGEYLMRIDSDDICLPDRMVKQVEFLDSHPEYALCGTLAQVIDNENNDVYVLRRPEIVKTEDIFKNCSFIHPSVMIRADVIGKVGGYESKKETRRAEDFDLWCRLYANGFKGYNIQEKHLLYREDFLAYKKRKFRHRIDIYKLMMSWKKRMKLPMKYWFYALKSLLVGFIPKKWLYNHKKRNLK